MNPAELLIDAAESGVNLRLNGYELSCTGPKTPLNRLMPVVKGLKAELMRLLENPPAMNPTDRYYCPFCSAKDHRTIEGCKTLCCQAIDKPVYKLPRCPFGYWERDERRIVRAAR